VKYTLKILVIESDAEKIEEVPNLRKRKVPALKSRKHASTTQQFEDQQVGNPNQKLSIKCREIVKWL
jgi:hypothetical protein